MITFTYSQLMAWVAALFWPAARLLALFAAAPFFNQTSIPAMAKVGIALLITIIIAPNLPAMPDAGVATPTVNSHCARSHVSPGVACQPRWPAMMVESTAARPNAGHIQPNTCGSSI